MDQRHTEVKLVPWSDQWVGLFEKEKVILEACLRKHGFEAKLLHTGSTSITGMISKPIIDILVLVEEGKQGAAAEALKTLGMTNLGECGRPGRYFLSADTKEFSYYIHVTTKDNQVAKDQLTFQRLEMENEVIRNGYIMEKLVVADMFPDDRNSYRLFKGGFIESVLAAYRQGLIDAGNEVKKVPCAT